MYEIKIIHMMKVTWVLSTYWPEGLKTQNTQSSFGKSTKIYRAIDSRGNPCFGISSYLPAVYTEMWTASR